MICTLTNYEETNEKCKQCEWIEDCKNDKPVPDEFRDKMVFAAKLWREAKELEQLSSDKMATAKGIFTTVIKDTKINNLRIENLSITLNSQTRKTLITEIVEQYLPPFVLEKATKITTFNVLRVRDLIGK
jgi:hypothetical protein